MKIIGAISFLFGLGLLAVFGYGFTQEMSNGTLFRGPGTLIALALLISGFSTVWFVLRTFTLEKIRDSAAYSDLLDLPEHIAGEGRAVNSFILSCGYVAFLSSLLVLLYTLYALFTVFFMIYDSTISMLFLINLLLLIGALGTVFYCVKKLFFSRA